MRLFGLLCALLTLSACGPPPEQAPDPGELLREEERLLAERSAEHSALAAFGPDPYRVDYLPGLDRYLVLLRNGSEVLLCNASLKVLDRRQTPRSPTGWDRDGQGRLYIAGELSSRVAVYGIGKDRLRPLEAIPLEESASVRDLAYRPSPTSSLFLVDGFDRQLIRVDLATGRQRHFPLGAGPARILHRDGHLVINLLYEHSILVLPLSGGMPDFARASRISNQGPFWSIDAAVQGDRLIVAAGGIENRPLDRGEGEFGNIDSFLHLFELPRKQGVFRWDADSRQRVRRRNLSQLQVVTPKALSLHSPSDGGLELWVAGSGSEKLAVFRIGLDRPGLDIVLKNLVEVAPGISDLRPHGRLPAFANPLLDRVEVVELSDRGGSVSRASLALSGERPASPSSRLGEALFSSTLLSPNNRSTGPLSRFTCEACHFEGGIDGRVHFTGREDIHLSTKTLRDLAGNVPLFSRGGDETLSSMVMAEFRVANQGDGDVFQLRPSHHPWMAGLGDLPDTLTPQQLRKAFLAFFFDLRHRPNPWRLRQGSLDPKAKRGLEVFRQRCADCHQPIEATRNGGAVPFEQWPRWLASEGRDLIWGAPFFSKTGIRPYVDPAGTRVPSLRRAWLKYPYFTDGSSGTIRDVLERFRYRGSIVWHHYDPNLESGAQPTALTAREIEALEALLRYF